MAIKSVATTLLIWMLLVCLFGVLGIKMLNWSKYYDLAKTAVKTTGHVTAKDPDNHRFIKYSFEVEGRSYSGTGNGGGENPEFDQLIIGDPVNVYYASQDPSSSFLGNPRRQSDSITIGVLFLALAGSSFSIFGLYVKGWLPVSKALKSGTRAAGKAEQG